MELLLDIVNYLKEHFEITSRLADMFVGLHITRDRQKRRLHLSQPTYTARMLAKFGMQDCRPQSTPADPSVKLIPTSVPVAPTGITYPFKEALSRKWCSANADAS